ncbi:MAG: hypothetical protein JXJ22_11735 [Bacteroidales bacterium]|nr:hypothetical protein [Bacteroidales bacterium]
MKTNYLIKVIGSMLLTIMLTGYSFAQTTTPPTQPSLATPHNVGVNSTHIYDVAYTVRGAVPNVYTWTIYTANSSYVKGAAATAGIDYNITAGGNDALQNIEWLVAGYYVVDLQETNPAAFGSCAGTLQSLNVFVGPTGTVEFSTATGTDQCPAAGGYSLALAYTGTVSYPITVDVQYTIAGATSTATISVANAGATLDIPAGVGFLANATTTDDLARTVTITGAKDSYGGDLTIEATNAHAFAVWSIPATTTIRHD